MTTEKLKKIKEFLYDMEVQTGLFSIQELTENTDMKQYIINFKKEFEEYPMCLHNFNEFYFDSNLNESTNKTFEEILNGFI